MAEFPVRPQTAPPAKLDLDFESTLGGAAYFKFLTDSLEGESGRTGSHNLSKLHAGLGGGAASSSGAFAPQPPRPSSTGWALEGSSSCLPPQMNALALAAASQQTTIQAPQLQVGSPNESSPRAEATCRAPPSRAPLTPVALAPAGERNGPGATQRAADPLDAKPG